MIDDDAPAHGLDLAVLTSGGRRWYLADEVDEKVGRALADRDEQIEQLKAELHATDVARLEALTYADLLGVRP